MAPWLARSVSSPFQVIPMARSLLSWILLVCLALGPAGCGGESGKGQNKDKDKPQPATTK